jgi:hypothetical protein
VDAIPMSGSALAVTVVMTVVHQIAHRKHNIFI